MKYYIISEHDIDTIIDQLRTTLNLICQILENADVATITKPDDNDHVDF